MRSLRQQFLQQWRLMITLPGLLHRTLQNNNSHYDRVAKTHNQKWLNRKTCFCMLWQMLVTGKREQAWVLLLLIIVLIVFFLDRYVSVWVCVCVCVLCGWLTLEFADCGDIEPISDPIVPQSFGLSLAPARSNNDIIVRTPYRINRAEST